MKIVIYVYEGITMLDAIGPYEVLRNLPDAQVVFVAKDKGEITADSEFVHLNVKHSIDEIDSADILLVPGSAIGFLREVNDKKVLTWINKIHATSQWTTSVCSGSLILAAAGLLKGLKATCHWKPMPLLQKFGATPTKERIVQQDKVITAAGVSAGIDMALFLCNEIAGEKTTKAIQLFIEYDPQPMYDSGNFSKAEDDVIKEAEKLLLHEAKKDKELFAMIQGTL